jgi:ribosome-associated protein
MQTISVPITGEYIELAALLKIAGLASSGGHAHLLIEDGIVACNGEAENRKRRKVRRGDKVQIGQVVINVV